MQGQQNIKEYCSYYILERAYETQILYAVTLLFLNKKSICFIWKQEVTKK
jgi:hypothetical protein